VPWAWDGWLAVSGLSAGSWPPGEISGASGKSGPNFDGDSPSPLAPHARKRNQLRQLGSLIRLRGCTNWHCSPKWWVFGRDRVMISFQWGHTCCSHEPPVWGGECRVCGIVFQGTDGQPVPGMRPVCPACGVEPGRSEGLVAVGLPEPHSDPDMVKACKEVLEHIGNALGRSVKIQRLGHCWPRRGRRQRRGCTLTG